MVKRKYRIKEFAGEFTIQVECNVSTGMLWWKEQSKKWVNTDIYGFPRVTCNLPSVVPYLPQSAIFDNIEEAMKSIEQFEKGVVYHDVDIKSK